MQYIACHNFFAIQNQFGRDVFRIQQHFHAGAQQSHAAVLQFNGLRFLGINHVQRQADFDRFASFHDLEVDVAHFAANRVHLEVAYNHVVLFAVQRQFDDGGVELFFLQGEEYGFVINGNSSGVRAGAVNYGRHTAFAAQAAARTSTLLFAHLGFDFKRHGKTPFKLKKPSAGLRPTLTAGITGGTMLPGMPHPR